MLIIEGFKKETQKMIFEIVLTQFNSLNYKHKLYQTHKVIISKCRDLR